MANPDIAEHVPGSSGSLIIRPGITGDQHWTGRPDEIEPFSIGDVDPSGSFVHVVNESSLNVIMQELDTITDFTEYLENKALFVRSERLSYANGEENLIAYYAIRISDNGEHDFQSHSDPSRYLNEPLEIDGTHFERMTSDARYIAKNKADEISYLWDKLIETFTTHMLNGTSVTLAGYEFDLRKNELGVRYMALERRFFRRNHGKAVIGALDIGRKKDVFFLLSSFV